MKSRLFTDAERERLRAKRETLPPALPLYVFGAGFTGMDVLDRLRRAGANVRGILDNNPAYDGTEMRGVPVYHPVRFAKEGHEEGLVLLAMHAVAAVAAQCGELGIRTPIRLDEFSARYGDLGEVAYLEGNAEAVAALDIWDDAESREAYRSLLRYKISFLQSDLPPCLKPQYFNPEVCPPEFLRSFVDCGAFDGDTYAVFSKVTGGDFADYYAFEPDPNTYAKLAANLPGDPRIHLFNKALGAEPGTLHFLTSDDKYSRAMPDGNCKVDIDTLDNALGASPVTMIKMDVESYEPDALRGGRGLIGRQRPALGISVYHRTSHLWEIPLLIARLNLDYGLKLRHHTMRTHYETVCYALPRK